MIRQQLCNEQSAETEEITQCVLMTAEFCVVCYVLIQVLQSEWSVSEDINMGMHFQQNTCTNIYSQAHIYMYMYIGHTLSAPDTCTRIEMHRKIHNLNGLKKNRNLTIITKILTRHTGNTSYDWLPWQQMRTNLSMRGDVIKAAISLHHKLILSTTITIIFQSLSTKIL